MANGSQLLSEFNLSSPFNSSHAPLQTVNPAQLLGTAALETSGSGIGSERSRSLDTAVVRSTHGHVHSPVPEDSPQVIASAHMQANSSFVAMGKAGHHAPIVRPRLMELTGTKDSSLNYLMNPAPFSSPVFSHFSFNSHLESPISPSYDHDEQTSGLADAFENLCGSPSASARSSESSGFHPPHSAPAHISSFVHASDAANVVGEHWMRTPPLSDPEEPSQWRGSPTAMTSFLKSPLFQRSPYMSSSVVGGPSDVFFGLLDDQLSLLDMGVCSSPTYIGGVGQTTSGHSSRSPSPHYNSHAVPASLGAVSAAAPERGPLTISTCLSSTGIPSPTDSMLDGKSALTLSPLPGSESEPASPTLVSRRPNGARQPSKNKKSQQLGPKSPTPDLTGTTKAFTCDVPDCLKSFKRAEHLKRHFHSVHTEERPFRCTVPMCDKQFSRLDNLKQHRRTHKSTKADTK